MMNRFFTILLFVGVLNTSSAQSIPFTRIGSVGPFSSGGYVASLATSFNAADDCLKLNTGVTLFAGSLGQRDFIVSCKSVLMERNLEFALFPNPVVTYSRLLATGMLPSMGPLNLFIIDAVGRVVWSKKIQSSSLHTGFVLILSTLSAGNYFLRVNGSELNKVIPFVKVH